MSWCLHFRSGKQNKWASSRKPWTSSSFPVVFGNFGCDVTCQACRESSPRTPRAIALVSKPPLVTRIARTGLGTRLLERVFQIELFESGQFLPFMSGRESQRNQFENLGCQRVFFSTNCWKVEFKPWLRSIWSYVSKTDLWSQNWEIAPRRKKANSWKQQLRWEQLSCFAAGLQWTKYMGKLFVQIKAVRLYWFEFASLNPVPLWTLKKPNSVYFFFKLSSKKPWVRESFFSHAPKCFGVRRRPTFFGRNHRVHGHPRHLQYLKNQGYYSSISWILASRNPYSYNGCFICHAISRSSRGDQWICWIIEVYAVPSFVVALTL